jgi:hypothetical protein
VLKFLTLSAAARHAHTGSYSGALALAPLRGEHVGCGHSGTGRGRMIDWSNGVPAEQPEQTRHLCDSNPNRVRLAAEPCVRHSRRPTTSEEPRRILGLVLATTAA